MSAELETTRISLSTGVTLKVQMGGPREGEAIILLHGFPESHRTWRHVAPALAQEHFVLVPDQRGYGGSDKPVGVENYRPDRTVADIFALADAFGIDRFTLVGHDWGGAISWAAALKHGDRLDRLVIVNAPHPLIFQRSLIDDEAQRRASQYIRLFRSPGAEKAIDAIGLDGLLARLLGDSKVGAEERESYLQDWRQEGTLTAMLNWYRASDFDVPEPGEKASKPLWTHAPFPHVKVPTLVIWGMQDQALLPVQLEGLGDLVDDLRVVRIEDGGHFVTWERPAPVIAAIRDFMKAAPST